MYLRQVLTGTQCPPIASSELAAIESIIKLNASSTQGELAE
jgi:hypothetical protein